MFNESFQATLLDVQATYIHQNLYYQIAYQKEGEGVTHQARINAEAFYPDPKPQDRLQITMLMGNIMSATKL